jgi:zinc/manganese transport system substrate-binding protein
VPQSIQSRDTGSLGWTNRDSANVINVLHAAQTKGTLKTELRKYTKPTLLILDEIGSLPFKNPCPNIRFSNNPFQPKFTPSPLTQTQSTCNVGISRHLFRMFRAFFATILLGILPTSAAELKVVVLHPLLVDLARQVGGDQVEIIDLIGPNGDPHHFEPMPADLKQAEDADLYLVAGMGLEGYLPKLKAIVGNRAQIIEVGASLPALEGACDHEVHDHDHAHEVDPHWWHSIPLFNRATRIVAEALTAAAPSHAEYFQKNSDNYRKELDALEHWAKREITKVPRERRHLATAHAAFNYFCNDFGFTPHPVQGINREQMPSPKALAKLVAELQKEQVVAIFPEKESNPKILQSLTRDTGIKLAGALIADGTGGLSYADMVRHNVNTITQALAK